MSTDQDLRPGAGAIPRPRRATSTSPTSTLTSSSASAAVSSRAGAVGEQVDVLSHRQVLEVYGRQADELAATVEWALGQERDQHAEQLRILDEQRHVPFDEQRRVLQAQHGRRVALLGLLADFLGEANAQLDEVAHQVMQETGR